MYYRDRINIIEYFIKFLLNSILYYMRIPIFLFCARYRVIIIIGISNDNDIFYTFFRYHYHLCIVLFRIGY